ncbi:MAG: hypothetical protein HY961_12895 [Ignavibacteriae bacterium]|nr:hypothetical protein [Ignavibacteriota bacterium]
MKRPVSVTIVAFLFIAAGIVGLVYHATEFDMRAQFQTDRLLILFVRLMAFVGGVYLLRGANWARWLVVAWIGYHVVLSIGHSTSELVMHSVIFVGVTALLFLPGASKYFRKSS